jgi:hypothetical protein
MRLKILKKDRGREGFSMILSLIFMYTMAAVLLMTVHFIVERKKAIKNLNRVEQELDQRHRLYRAGEKKWDVVINEPPKDKLELSKRIKKSFHRIFVEF